MATSNPIGTVTTASLTSAQLASMDIETALMAVQTQRANLLEGQLKDQMETVRNRNQQIETLNTILSKVRDQRPSTTDGKATPSGTVNVPGSVTGTAGVNTAEIARLEGEADQLQLWLNAKSGTTGTTGTTGTGTTGGNTLAVPSTVKVPAVTANTDARAPYAKAINELVDANAQTGSSANYANFVGGNGSTVAAFVTYYEQHKGTFPAPVPANMTLGFNANSDAGDIARAFQDPNVRAAFEVYARLAYQAGGSPGRPLTPIVAPAGSSGGGGTTGTGTGNTTTIGGLGPNSSATELRAAIDQRRSDIAALNAAGNTVTTTDTMTAMGLQDALRSYGFKTGELNQGEFDQLISNITSKIDSLNSSQQLDMLRLQSLTNKRNEAFDIMTNFIKKLQDNRSSVISNMR
jgi:hypothetical protein